MTKTRTYYFSCGCGRPECDTRSEPLTKDNYIRLRPGRVWVSAKCWENNPPEGYDRESVFHGGVIAQEVDF